jgi:hypothetical protein
MSTLTLRRSRTRYSLALDPRSPDLPHGHAGLKPDAVRSDLDDAVRMIMAVLRATGLLGDRRRAGESPRAEDQLRDYLEHEVTGATMTAIAMRRGITERAARKSVARGKALVESTRGRLAEGGFSSPLAAAEARERGPRNEGSW